jgi:hypothetical protein
MLIGKEGLVIDMRERERECPSLLVSYPHLMREIGELLLLLVLLLFSKILYSFTYFIHLKHDSPNSFIHSFIH